VSERSVGRALFGKAGKNHSILVVVVVVVAAAVVVVFSSASLHGLSSGYKWGR
jgi:hypothetical protein